MEENDSSVIAVISQEKSRWAWQTVLDTLAVGENIPLMLIHRGRLGDLDQEIRDLCVDKNIEVAYERKKDFRPRQKNSPSLLAFYEEILNGKELREHIKSWIKVVHDVCSSDIGSSTEKQNLFSTDESWFLEMMYPFLERNIFLSLPANAVPLDNISKNSMLCWRWFNLFWLYDRLIEKDLLDSLRRDKLCICEQAYGINNFYFGLTEVPSKPDYILLSGPVFRPQNSPLAEYAYETEVINPAVEYIMRFYSNLANHGRSVVRARFLRAALAEPPTPKPNFEARVRRIKEALFLLKNWPIEGRLPVRYADLRVMVLWALFIAQRGRIFFSHLQTFSGTFTPEIALKLESDYPDEHSVETWLSAKLHGNSTESIRLSISYSVLNHCDTGGDDYGFRLERLTKPEGWADDDKAIKDDMAELRLQFSHLLIRFDQKTRLLDNKRVLIFNDWLQERLGTLISELEDAQYSSKHICRWVNELLRADVTALYEYKARKSTLGVLKRMGIFFHDLTQHLHTESPSRILEKMGDDLESRSKCICYRALDRGEQIAVLSYDPVTGKSIPENEPLCLPDGDFVLPINSVIATPVEFNGRGFAVLEVQAKSAWRFRWGQRIPLQQVASAIAPFLFQHRYLDALKTIQDAILKFHHDDRNSGEESLYKIICKELTALFLCDGASIWVRDTGNTNLFQRAGFYNIKRAHQVIDMGCKDSFAYEVITEYEQQPADQRLFCSTKVTNKSHVMLERDELHEQGVGWLTILLIPDDEGNRAAACLSLYSKGSDYTESWKGIMGFISNYLALVVEAVNAFIQARKFGASIHAHEMYHDAAYIADKGKKLSRASGQIRYVADTLSALLTSPSFKIKEMNMLGILNDHQYEELLRFPQEINSRIFLPSKDLAFFSDTLRTRVQMMFGNNNKELSSEAQDFLSLTGDENLTRDISWGESEDWVQLQDIYNAIKEGDHRVRGKGLYLLFDNQVNRNLEILMRKTILVTIFRNLLQNAIKYSELHSSITVTIKKLRSGIFVFSVENTGKSFKKANEEIRVLGPMARGTNSRGIDGMGMGLYNVRQLSCHLLNMEFTFRETPLGRGNSNFLAELLIPNNRVR